MVLVAVVVADELETGDKEVLLQVVRSSGWSL